MISPAQADQLIAEHLTCLPIESLPLVQCFGGVLRENVYAERDKPPFDRVAMDGVALRDTRHAIEIMTGAVLPQSTDTVIPEDQIEVRDGTVRLHAEVVVHARK